MNRFLGLVPLVVCTALLGGCLVPSLSELESERARSCDADHPCVAGYSCVANQCVLGLGRLCTPGDKQPCGTDVGMCEVGARTCGQNGQFGECEGATNPTGEICDSQDNDCDGEVDEGLQLALSCGVELGVCAGKQRACVSGAYEQTCSSASYGPDYEPVETRCDGLDNDCDGIVDGTVSGPITRPCELTEGICALAKATCSGGQWQRCGAAEYASVPDTRWEQTESTCDGQDNDCDGRVDSDEAQWVAQDGQPDMPVVVPLGTGDRRPMVVAWEQGDTVRARQVRADGTLEEVIAPASTVTLAGYRSSGPAVLRCNCDSCGCHALAWFDSRSCDAGTCNRLLIGTLEDEGWTSVGGSGSRDAGKVTTADTTLGKGLSMQLVAAGGRVYGAYAHMTEGGVPEVMMFNCPGDLFSSFCSRVTLGRGSEPTLSSVMDGGTEAAVAWWAPGEGLKVAGLDLTTLAWATLPAPAPTWSGTAADVADSVYEHLPHLAPSPSGGWDLFSVDVTPAGPNQLQMRTGGCTSASCGLAGAAAAPYSLGVEGPTVALSFERRPELDVFAAQVQADGGSQLLLVSRSPARADWVATVARPVGTPGSTAPFVTRAGTMTTVVYRAADGGITSEMACSSP